jgi:two-component system sensor histidine kinase KdpD
MTKQQGWIGYGEALIGVSLVTLAGWILFSRGILSPQFDDVTVTLSYLLVVLLTASRRGLGAGIFASIAGMICFDFFFLPPTHEIQPEDPQSWVSLVAFLVTAIVASRLWAASRAREQESRRQREQIQKLYNLSCAIIAKLNPADLVSSIAQEVLETFGYRHCGLFQKDESGVWECRSVAHAAWARVSFDPEADVIESVFRTGNPNSSMGAVGNLWCRWSLIKKVRKRVTDDFYVYVPSKSGSSVVAVLILVSDQPETESMGAIGSLVALALERARLLNEVQLKESLKQSDKLKSALLASVSHNLRTPLTSIRASIESIITADTGDDNPLLREFHLIISEEVNRLSRLVDHLLEMARLEAGELRPRKQRISISEVFDSVLRSCAPIARRHELRLCCSEDLPLINADPRMIAEVLTNLIENAVKYSPPGTGIDLAAGSEGDALWVSVADHGQGIAAAEKERIFDKFYRGSHPQHQMQDGTGMGLAIARGLVEAHGGSIWVESMPGRGATFKFTVPIDRTVPLETPLGMIKS